MSDEEDDYEEDEQLPELPLIARVLEEKLLELNQKDDWEKIKKIELAHAIETILDSLVDLARHMVVIDYNVKILGETINTLLYGADLNNELKTAVANFKKRPERQTDQAMHI